MLVPDIGLKGPFHFVDMAVFRFDGQTGNAAEIVSVICIGGDAVIEVKMQAAQAKHISCISNKPVIVAVLRPAVESEFVGMRFHFCLRCGKE